MMFLFVTIVILLNILIAQLTNTYQSAQNEAKRIVQANIAWFIARIEQDELSRLTNSRFYKRKSDKTDEDSIVLKASDLAKMGDLKVCLIATSKSNKSEIQSDFSPKQMKMDEELICQLEYLKDVLITILDERRVKTSLTQNKCLQQLNMKCQNIRQGATAVNKQQYQAR